MSEVTQILSQIEGGDPAAAEQLLPLVYDELCALARANMAHEKPGQTLSATALVHEAYLRLVDVEVTQRWENRRHFFAAAAEAMRRILIEAARRKNRIKHGGSLQRVELELDALSIEHSVEDLLAIHEALEKLEDTDEQAAELLKLTYFAGMTVEQAAELIEIPVRTAYRSWAYARAWIGKQVGASDVSPKD